MSMPYQMVKNPKNHDRIIYLASLIFPSMKDYRFYLFFIALSVNLVAAYVLYQLNRIFGLIFFSLLVVQSISMVLLYLNYIGWPYDKWISTNIVDIDHVEIDTALEGEIIKATVIRNKVHDPSKKHVGVLFHHGYTGKKEKIYKFAIPLAMNGCVVLCPDARGHGESKKKPLNMSDFKGIMADVEKEIDYLQELEDVDADKLAMMGHSMGGIMTLSAGYRDPRIKKLVAISAPYDMLKMFRKNKTIISRFIFFMVTRFIKKDPEFTASGESLEEWNKKISAKYAVQTESPFPDEERVYLAHCKNDDLVLFEESVSLKDALNLPDENVLFLDKPEKKYIQAAHNLTGQTPLIASFCVQVANSLKD